MYHKENQIKMTVRIETKFFEDYIEHHEVCLKRKKYMSDYFRFCLLLMSSTFSIDSLSNLGNFDPNSILQGYT